MNKKLKKGNIIQIENELERRLIVMRYCETTINTYLRILGWIGDFLEAYGENDYTKESGQRFLAEYPIRHSNSPTEFNSAKAVIRHMDEILSGKPFAPKFIEPKRECPSRFMDWQDKYCGHLEKRGLRHPSIANHRRYSGRLLGCLDGSLDCLEALSASDLYAVFTSYEWPLGSLPAARGLLAFLFDVGVTKADLSMCVPAPRRPQPLPSIYTSSELFVRIVIFKPFFIRGRTDKAIYAAETAVEAEGLFLPFVGS